MTIREESQIQAKEIEQSSNADTVLGFAVLGCLLAGIVGVYKATQMQGGFDVLLCLVGSVAGFGAVFYIYLGRHR
jgi:hypothetical protein